MRPLKVSWLTIVTHIIALAPLVALLWAFWQRRLGPDLIGEATRRTGRYALFFLMLSLTPTVISRLSGWKKVLRVRRTLGLYAFMYVAIHLFMHVGLDYGFDLGLFIETLPESPFILAGLAAWLILVPLAITSTTGWVRRLGRNWARLHRLVYLAGALAVIHYAWHFKELRIQPLLVGIALALLLLARFSPIAVFLRRRAVTPDLR